MKNRFTSLDLRASISELQKKYQGMRVMNVYDVDNKTYLIKLAKPDQKAMILIESGIRIHSTDFEWPKNITPSSFSMKLRKHLRTRRLEGLTQLGNDRIVDIQFGSGEAAYHIILELYDRGNIVLTDHEYMILNILRPRTESETVRFAVHQRYPISPSTQSDGCNPGEKLMSVLLGAKEGDNLKKTLTPNFAYGPALIEHSLMSVGIPSNARIGKDFNISEDVPKLVAGLEEAERLMELAKNGCKGYIIQKKEKPALRKSEDEPEELLMYSEFHPFLFMQHEKLHYVEVDSFDKAVDEFFSKCGSQKTDMKIVQQERAAMKKLEHIKKDHEKRLMDLKQEQDIDTNKAQLIEMNLDLVNRAILVVRSAIANQIDWDEIHTIVKEAQMQGDPVAMSIKTLKLQTNHITLFLKNPYLDSDEEEDSADAVTPMKVDIDLELSAYANARKYFDKKRKATAKEQKTIDASSKALKSAERKTFQMLKEVQTVVKINKARKTYWFEKFLWFISSENYVVIGGRDQQQNEYIVKRYLRPGDIYVHADLHGASSVIIKNPSGQPVPPKTLNEAGTMALCNSAAWDARVVTSAWWVYHNQVSKTAPTGEYLTTGSFMIRGKKNFLPPSYLVYGFGFIFKVDEDSVFRHKGERRVRNLDDDADSALEPESSQDQDVCTESDLMSTASGPECNPGSESSSDNDSQMDDVSSADGSEHLGACPAGRMDGDVLPNTEKTGQSKLSDDLLSGNLAAQHDKQNDDDKTYDPCHDELKTQTTHEETVVNYATDEEECLFPDTNIELQYVEGAKLQVQVCRTTSVTSTDSTEPASDLMSDTTRPPTVNKGGAKLSAKQRREMRKRAKETQKENVEDIHENEMSSQDSQKSMDYLNQEQHSKKQPSSHESTNQQAPVLKRRQKSKLKKIKEKYKDQDEEERQLRMEILASAGVPKEVKKKGKKGKQQNNPPSAPDKMQQQGQGHKPYPPRKLTVEDIKEESSTVLQSADVTDSDPVGSQSKTDEALSDEEKQMLLEEEKIQLGQVLDELDSLTGIPVPEDILHFCIPVCAPYSAVLNYKFKVKLTPGTTKRGKAAKAALHSFLTDKNTTSREKDLFKSLKDVDLSRNIPGKVKVSAPNILKHKKK